MKINGLKIAYIGGGSRGWAKTFMNDIALQDNFCGTVRLYDIDKQAAENNKIIGDMIKNESAALSKWDYEVCDTLKGALTGADFVVISILPGTFDEMESDVHEPEKYGIYQSVGDTAGPGGILRAMRTIPIYEGFARAIKEYCPKAFIINFTNPMTLCTRTLYGVFPEIRAIGCCHEVFGTQKFLANVAMEMLGIKNIRRQEIKTDVSGVNHFTWFTKAEYNNTDLFPVYAEYVKKHMGDSINKETEGNPFLGTNLVKMDLFRRYGQIAAAGDRHLAEFMNNSWYLKDPETIKRWGFGLTSVEWRRSDLALRLKQTQERLDKITPVTPEQSDEEFVLLMEGLLGIKDFISNVNLPNSGQAPYAPIGAVVETNASFTKGRITPLKPAPLAPLPQALVTRVISQQENAFNAISRRNISDTFNVFLSEPLCSSLSLSDGEKLFEKMTLNTKKYLTDWKI